MKHDIENLDHIKTLVNSFYAKVQKDPLIGGIFVSTIDDWPKHLNIMYTFWQTLLLSEHTYHGAPFKPHAQMSIEKVHFDRWLALWETTVDELFQGTIADEAKWRGQKMAELFLTKLRYQKENRFKSLF